MRNSKQQKLEVFGKTAQPSTKTKMRAKHMKHIKTYIKDVIGLKNNVTKGKLNASGKHIMKPDWTKGQLEYEPNPEAAVHELGHLYLAPMGMSLGDIQRNMDKQYGFVNSHFGYAQQKKSYFEVSAMAMEQKIRRRMGLPASTKAVVVTNKDAPRVSVDCKSVIAERIVKRGKVLDLIRSSRNLDKGCLERLEMIDNGEIIFDIKKGWVQNNSIDAKINRRARLQAKSAVKLQTKKAA